MQLPPLSCLAAPLLLHGAAAAWNQALLVDPQSRCGTGRTIMDELGPLLSEGAVITLPSQPGADALLARAAGPRVSPEYVAVVEVATEHDVQQTIRCANRHQTPFLVVAGAHGWTWTLSRVERGIQINMRKMNRTTLHADGKTATVGGGTLQHELNTALFAQGRQAVTGICECVSFAGPLLGSGHGLLQRRHGFAVDSLVSARLVLADGSAVDVSADERPDLFWAIRGAGHNLGVVTSLDIMTYPVRATWTMTTLTFTHDKAEAFFDRWNEVEEAHKDPGMVAAVATMARNDSLDREHPVIILQLFHEGVNAAAGEYAAAFRRLGPAAESIVRDIAWVDVHRVGGYGIGSPACRPNNNLAGFAHSTDRWDAAAMRKALDLFAQLTDDKTFATSIFLLELYGQAGVRAVPEWESAVAPEDRRLPMVMTSAIFWAGHDEADTRKALAYGKAIQRAVRGSDPAPHVYVNYGAGDETLAEVYGRDAARLARLRRIKKRYDAHNRFGYYMPIR